MPRFTFWKSVSLLVTLAVTSVTFAQTTPVAPTLSAQAQTAIALAEELYPALFKNGDAAKIYQDYVYRFYASTGIYIGFKNDRIYLLGGAFGNAIVDKGTVSAVVTSLQAVKASKAPVVVVTPPATGGGSGPYTLTVTGKFTTTGAAAASLDIPAIVIPNQTETPNPADTNEIVLEIKEYFSDVSGITNVKVQVVNNTTTRVTIRVEFTAVMPNVGTVLYDVLMDYKKS
jgi:hypothetical protein